MICSSEGCRKKDDNGAARDWDFSVRFCTQQDRVCARPPNSVSGCVRVSGKDPDRNITITLLLFISFVQMMQGSRVFGGHFCDTQLGIRLLNVGTSERGGRIETETSVKTSKGLLTYLVARMRRQARIRTQLYCSRKLIK